MPVKTPIPLCKMYMDDDIKEAVLKVLDSGMFVKGKEAELFEKEFASYIGANEAISVSSGTSGLFVIFDYLVQTHQLKFGDEIIIPSLTFIATATPAVFFGLKPIFVDADPLEYTMGIESIKKAITKKTKAIIMVHLFGVPCNMDEIMEIAEKNNLIVIEDCCQAHGSRYSSQKVGTIGNYGVFSFFPSKIMSVCGEGGMIVTDDKNSSDVMRRLKDHGRTDKYTHEFFGFNMRMSEIHASIGRVQLRKIDEFIVKRREYDSRYTDVFSRIWKDVTLQRCPAESSPVMYVYTLQVDNRTDFMNYLKKNGVNTGIHYPRPLHQQYIMRYKTKIVPLPVTERICDRIVSIPFSHAMTVQEVNHVIRTIKRYFKN